VGVASWQAPKGWGTAGKVGKVGRVASEEVTLHLIKSKCIPVLLYGLEVCPLNKSQIVSLDFVINRFFMKLFNTNNMEIIRACQSYFSFKLPSVLILMRVNKFTARTNAIWDFSGFFLFDIAVSIAVCSTRQFCESNSKLLFFCLIFVYQYSFGKIKIIITFSSIGWINPLELVQQIKHCIFLGIKLTLVLYMVAFINPS